MATTGHQVEAGRREEAPPPGWYPDPAKQAEQRYWDGARWTNGVVRDGDVTEEALPADGAEAAWSEWHDVHTDQRVEWPGPTAVMGVAGWAVAMAFTLAGAVIAALAGFGDLGTLVCTQLGLWTGLLATCWFVSHRYGTGDLGQDYRLAFWRKDVGWGLLLGLAARAAAIAVTIPFVFMGDRFQDAPRQFPELDRSVVAVAVLVAVACVGAPVIEELFFRGLLQRSLETVLPVGAAIGLQAVLFGAVHTNPDIGLVNIPLVLAVSAAGAVFGIAAWKWHRLGPGIAAHAFFNLGPTLVFVFAG